MPKRWTDIDQLVTGIRPLGSSDVETMRYHFPILDNQVSEILQEYDSRPFTAGPFGHVQAPKLKTPEPPLDVQRALRYLRVVQRTNASIHDLRRRGLGLAQSMKYLVLDKDQEKLINNWRKKNGLDPI